MAFWRSLEFIGGISLLLIGLFKKKFTPLGITTMLIWGDGKDALIPRWIAASCYVFVGLLLLYFAMTGKY